jgi:hypothetical protein
VSSNLQDIDKEKEREELHKKEFGIQTELYQLRTIIKDSEERRRQLFIEWADLLERQIELGIIIIPKKGIATRMAKAIRTRGGDESEIVYMYKCLPFEYKTSHEVEAVSSTENHKLAMQNKSCCEESKAIAQDALRKQAENKEVDFTHFTKSQLQDYTMAADEDAYRAHQACQDRHYETVDTTSADQSDLFELEDKYNEKMHINKPRPKEGYYYEALCILRDIIDACAKKAKAYSGEEVDENGNVIRPPITDEQDESFAKAVYVLCGLFAPYIDDKWRRDWFQWYRIIKDRLEYSLHGAMSKSKIPTSMAGALRGITREQIDAKVPVGYKLFKQLVEDMPGLWAIHEFYTQFQQPYLGDLTVRMKEKMSHLS